MTAPVLIRQMRDADHAFVFSSFLKSHRRAPEAVILHDTEYFPRFKEACHQLLQAYRGLVAHSPGDVDQIAGWLLWSGREVGYVYVKHYARRLGIMTALLNAAGFNWEAQFMYPPRPSVVKGMRGKGWKVT